MSEEMTTVIILYDCHEDLFLVQKKINESLIYLERKGENWSGREKQVND